MRSTSHKSDSSEILGTDSTVYAPIFLLATLILASGITGLLSVHSHNLYVEHVGFELVPTITLATETENALYLSVNAERGLLTVSESKLRQQRLKSDHTKYLDRARVHIGALQHEITEAREISHRNVNFHGPERSVDELPLLELFENWASASTHVTKTAQISSKGDSEIQFALSESMITFTALNTRIRDLKHSIVEEFEDETEGSLLYVNLFRIGLWITTGFGIVLGIYSIYLLKRKLSQLGSNLNLHIRRQDFSRQIAEALEMEDSQNGLDRIASRVLTELCEDNPAELLLSGPDNSLARSAENLNAGSAQCKVDKTLSCVAMRRGQLTIFRDSDAINCCPHLVGRQSSATAAICAPVTFMGSGLGIVHAIYPVDDLPTEHRQEQLKVFSSQLAARMGTVRAFDQTQTLSATDSLTGLLNRRGLEQMELNLDGHDHALAVLDLDFFKQLNDSHGHDMGDKALVAFAGVLESTLPEDALICRWGGEEFSVILPDQLAEQAYVNIENVRVKLANHLRESDLPTFTVSAGVADNTMSDNLRGLTILADQALYRAKSEGRNCTILSSELLSEKSHADFSIVESDSTSTTQNTTSKVA